MGILDRTGGREGVGGGREGRGIPIQFGGRLRGRGIPIQSGGRLRGRVPLSCPGEERRGEEGEWSERYTCSVQGEG